FAAIAMLPPDMSPQIGIPNAWRLPRGAGQAMTYQDHRHLAPRRMRGTDRAPAQADREAFGTRARDRLGEGHAGSVAVEPSRLRVAPKADHFSDGCGDVSELILKRGDPSRRRADDYDGLGRGPDK